MKYTKEDVIDLPEIMDAVIMNVELKKAIEVFGDNASNPEQNVISIYYENAELGFKNNETFNHYPIGKVPPKSKLGKFITKYDGLEVGIKIRLLQNKDGYFRIIIE